MTCINGCPGLMSLGAKWDNTGGALQYEVRILSQYCLKGVG